MAGKHKQNVSRIKPNQISLNDSLLATNAHKKKKKKTETQILLCYALFSAFNLYLKKKKTSLSVLYYKCVLPRVVLQARSLLLSKSWADESGAQLIHLPNHNNRHVPIPAELPADTLIVGC